MMDKYQIFDDLIEGVQILDENLKYLYVNKSVAAQGKETVESLIGHTIPEKYPGFENTEAYGAIMRCLQDQQPIEIRNEFDHKDGTKGYFELKIRPVPEGVLILSADVTETVLYERELNEAYSRLDALANVKPDDTLQSSDVETELTAYKNLNSIKDKFFRIVAHDLKSPLTSLKLFTEIIADSEANDIEDIKYIGKNLSNSIDKAITLADNLTKWSMLQMNQFETNATEIDLNSIISNVVGLYDDIAQLKGVSLTVVEQNKGKALADRDQIEFIIRNLVNNAIKFTPAKGSVEINISEQSESKVCLSISDDGVGIAPEKVDSLFELNTGYTTLGTNGEKGTGLGLVLSNEFARLNGGSIEVDSQIDEGTEFKLCLNSA